jgi:hypothetical protein
MTNILINTHNFSLPETSKLSWRAFADKLLKIISPAEPCIKPECDFTLNTYFLKPQNLQLHFSSLEKQLSIGSKQN